MNGHHTISRNIAERIHISGRLDLLTPAHFGNGEVRGDALVDMTLLLDEVDRIALIPGTTIAGALRSYLRERLYGFGAREPDQKNSPVTRLFGPLRTGTRAVDQSLLIVDDALALTEGTTLRDGVCIDPLSATAFPKRKFDIELLEAGTAFDLHFELLVKTDETQSLLPFVAAALSGLEYEEIRLGARKTRGFGQCKVSGWTVSRYRLKDPHDLMLWLATPAHQHRKDASYGPIAVALADIIPVADRRSTATLTATFTLEGSSMLIRSGFGEADSGPDMEHLHASHVDGSRWPVIPGTTWAGVLRHRALRIARTLATDAGTSLENANKLVDDMFGIMPKDNDGGQASRITVNESRIDGGQSLYQTRVRIDRFTGGAFEGALYEQAPVYGSTGANVQLRLKLSNPQGYEIGMLILLLKDLWTGDLTVGGEASVGRGHLTGINATLQHSSKILLEDGAPSLGLSAEDQKALKGFVAELSAHLGWMKGAGQ